MGTPHVVIRADANRAIGLGHVSRCISIAEALQELGATVTLLVRPSDIDVRGYAWARGVETHEIVADDEATDAAAVCAYLAQRPCHAVIVDHYALGVAWERAVHPCVSRSLAIDDIGREHATSLLLDQNAGAPETRPYDGRVPDQCVQLLGPHFALLPRLVRHAAHVASARSGDVARVLVFFGGADHTGETLKALEALSDDAFASWHVDVVSVSDGVMAERVRALVAARPRTMLYGLRPHLADLMLRADLAVGAGGTSTWERLALGLPSLVTLIAENQRQATAALTAAGAIQLVGEATRTTAQDYRHALERCLHGVHAPPALVDGWGATRVAAMVLGTHVAYDARVSHDRGECLATVVRGGAPVGSVRASVGAVQPMQVDVALSVDSAPALRAAARAFAGQTTGGAPWLSPAQPQRRIVILSDRQSWLNAWIPALVEQLIGDGHAVCWTHAMAAAPAADMCFLLGWLHLVSADERARFGRVLVVHESAVPHGRGMSPLTWQVLEGKRDIPVSLLEAVDAVDAGDVFDQRVMHFEGFELVEELRSAQARATIALCAEHVRQDVAGTLTRVPQSGEPSYYARRGPADSELDPRLPIAEQFDLLRVVDNDRYPAFFQWRGRRFVLRIQPDDGQQP